MTHRKQIKRLEAIMDALTDSLYVVSHNPVETEHVLELRQKYGKHYKELTGRNYRAREYNNNDKGGIS